MEDKNTIRTVIPDVSIENYKFMSIFNRLNCIIEYILLFEEERGPIMETINTNETWIEFQEKCTWHRTCRGENICTKGEKCAFNEKGAFTCSKELCERIK